MDGSLESTVSSTGGTVRADGWRKVEAVADQETSDGPLEDEGGLPAILAAMVILIVIVVLFLLFKFNLFEGGSSVNVRTTAPALTWMG